MADETAPGTETPAVAESSPATPAPEAVTPPAAPPAETSTANATLDWRQALETADPRELRRHPKVAGLIGSEIQTDRERTRKESEEATRRRTLEEQEAELLQLLDENDETLRVKYPKAREKLVSIRQARAEESRSAAVAAAEEELIRAVGQTYGAVPEWAELGADDHRRLEEAAEKAVRETGGLDRRAVLVAVNREAIELLAEKRAARRLREYRDRELPKEREAIRAEESAKLLKGSAAPGLAAGRGGPAVDVGAMSDKEFDEFWDRHVKR